MADISRIRILLNGVNRGLDLAANTLVTLSIKVGGGVSNSELTKVILDKLIDLQDGGDAGALHHHDAAYHTKAILASTSAGEGASLIGIQDSANQFASAHVEGALAEALDAAQAAQADATQALSDAAAAQADADAVIEDVSHLVTLSGRPVDSDNLGTFSGSIIPDNQTIKSALQSLETSIEALPDPMEYKGNWAASTNTPSLADGVGDNGDVYYVTDSGSVDFGAGAIAFNAGDRVVYSGADSVWQKWDATDAVTSVNGMMGAVTLDTDDVNEGSTNLYFTTARARTAAVVNSTAGNETDQAASVAALKAYVAGASVSSVPTVISTELAGEALSANTVYAMRWGIAANSETVGRLYKADYDATTNDYFYVDAIVVTTGAVSTGGSIDAVKVGKVTATGHGLTAGLPFYLGASGVVSNTASSTNNQAVVYLGKVQDANTLDVSVRVEGVN